jgi:hypothetical protein
MELIYNVQSKRRKIESSIKKHGFFAEHNYVHFSNQKDKYSENVFAPFENKRSILALKYTDDEWELFPEIIAPKEDRIDILDSFLDHIFRKENAKKISVEVTSPTRKEILQKLKTKYHLCRLNYSLVWPVFNMKTWDPSLPGKNFKKVRNLINRFKRFHDYEVVDSVKIDKDRLKGLVDRWINIRLANDRVYKAPLYNLIENKFKGCDFARSVLVDDEPCTITAGWKIPNSNNYYSAIGVLNYKHKGLGEFANVDDLRFLQKKGFDHVDFGGSDEYLLDFKKKFGPEHTYKTHIFSIMPRR